MKYYLIIAVIMLIIVYSYICYWQNKKSDMIETDYEKIIFMTIQSLVISFFWIVTIPCFITYKLLYYIIKKKL